MKGHSRQKRKPFLPLPKAAPAATIGKNVNGSANEVAVISTGYGPMVIAFWPEVAPNTVENFKRLARQGFYDGTAFHRVIKDFMIQGGDPLTKDPAATDRWGTGDPGYSIKAEFNERPHGRGVISMARCADPDSAGCQFFICLAEAPFLDGQYTAFGQLVQGDDVLGRIGNVPTARGSDGEESKPAVRVSVQSIRIVPADSARA
jgi:peptidyl-prolyl cis-trans isomerase B (cyclophilin B)